MKTAIGIDIGGTNTKLGVVTEAGELLCFTTFPTAFTKNFEEYSDRVKLEVDQLLALTKLSYQQIEGVGVGAPNGNAHSGKIECPPNLKHWGTVDLVTPFQKRFNKKILLENDANVAALGEGKWGVAKGMKDFVVITLGTGVGSGIVANGELIRGANGMASEGGHITIEKNGRNCGCGGRGHLEDYASVRGIKLTTKEITSEDLTFKEISDRYHLQDKDILKVFEQTAEYLAEGLAIIGTLHAPEAIILAGGVASIGEKLRADTEKIYNQLVYPPFRGQTKILISSISTSEGAVLGAASLLL